MRHILTRLIVSLVAAFQLTAWASAAESTEQPSQVRPNIVLILADDLGINDLACYGRADHRTPNLDRLADQGLRFTSAYCAQPICSPSRAALMTGKCPARLHLTNYLPGRPDTNSQPLIQPIIEGQLPLEEMTIAEWLKSVGYATGIFGKWHLGNNAFGPQAQGFDEAFLPPGNSPPTETEGGKNEYAITSAAENFIRQHRDEPFFCYVPHHTPHIPLAAKPELIESNRDAFHPVYAAMIETLDDTVGRLMALVDELQLTDRTIFIFTSDNGGLHVLEFPGTPATHNTPFRAGKGYVYEGGLREPLIVRWPGVVTPHTTTDTPVVLSDLVPTLLEAAGIKLDTTVGPLDGVSLLPLLRGEAIGPRPLYWHFPNYTNQGGRPAGAMRDGDWKLVEQYEDNSLELYNLANDIGETRDVSATESGRAKQMQQSLAAWRTSVGAQELQHNPDFDAALHRALYIDTDPSQLRPEATAAATEPHWTAWRKQMNATTKGRRAQVTPPTGDIRLHAKDARVHGERLRYEPESHKNVLGYWTNASDWADWEFEVPVAGAYEVEIQQGCGSGNGGSEVDVVIGDTTLSFTVIETGHFQRMIQRTIGQVTLPAGRTTLAIRPRTKARAAVMDVRRVVLRPR
ncbi:MAG: sulfatase-like hydrolase/transferase [Planctomycetales bacterium]|nr:sulfatase-like hydrolase/transferase [Planctomycetales bacterium]